MDINVHSGTGVDFSHSDLLLSFPYPIKHLVELASLSDIPSGSLYQQVTVNSFTEIPRSIFTVSDPDTPKFKHLPVLPLSFDVYDKLGNNLEIEKRNLAYGYD